MNPTIVDRGTTDLPRELMDGPMDGPMDGLMDGPMDGHMDGLMDGPMDGQIHGRTHGRTDPWTDPWTDAWTDTDLIPLWTLEVEQRHAHTVTDRPSRRPDIVDSGRVVS